MTSSTVKSGILSKQQTEKRSYNFTLTTFESKEAAGAGTIFKHMSKSRKMNADCVPAITKADPDIVVGGCRESVEKTANTVAQFKSNCIEELRHQPKGIRRQDNKARIKNIQGAHLEQDKNNDGRVAGSANQSAYTLRVGTQRRESVSRLPVISNARQIPWRQTIVCCKEIANRGCDSKHEDNCLRPLKSSLSAFKTAHQSIKSAALVSHCEPPDVPNKVGTHRVRNTARSLKETTSSEYPTLSYVKPKRCVKTQQFLDSVSDCAMNAMLNTNVTRQKLQRFQKAVKNVNEGETMTAMNHCRRKPPLKEKHATSAPDTQPEDQPSVSREVIRNNDFMRRSAGKSINKDEDRRLRRLIIDPTCDIATESSSENLSVISREKSASNARTTESRPTGARVGSWDREDTEHSGVDADRSSSDECDPSSTICDVTFIVEKEQDSEYKPLHTAFDPMTAFKIAYDVDNSESSSRLSATSSRIASACGSLELVEVIESKSYQGQNEINQPVSVVQVSDSKSSVKSICQHSGGGSSFGILNDTQLVDNSLLKPSFKFSCEIKSPTSKHSTKSSLISTVSTLACVPKNCVKNLDESIQNVSLVADNDQYSISSESSESVYFCLNVANCVTSTPRSSPVLANTCGLRRYYSKSYEEFQGDIDTCCSKQPCAAQVDSACKLRMCSTRKKDLPNRMQPRCTLDVAEDGFKAQRIVSHTLKKYSDNIQTSSYHQVSKAINNIGNRLNSGVCNSTSDTRLNATTQLRVMGNCRNHDDKCLGSQLQLYHISGAGEDLSSFKDDDVDDDDDVILSYFDRVDNNGENHLPSIPNELESQTITKLASRSEKCSTPGVRATFDKDLLVEFNFSPKDIFLNWSFSCLACPKSTASNSSQTAVGTAKSLASSTSGASASTSVVDVIAPPPSRCDDDHSVVSTSADSMKESATYVTGLRRSRVVMSVQSTSSDCLIPHATHSDVMVEPASRDIKGVDATSTNVDEDYHCIQLPQHSTPTTSTRRRLPVLKSLNSSIRPPGSSKLSLSSSSLPAAVDNQQDDRCIKVIVEMENQVKETVIGYVADSQEQLTESVLTNNGSSFSSVRDRSANVQAPVSSADKRQYVGSLIKAWNLQQEKSNERPVSARSAGEATLIRTQSVSVPKLSLGTAVYKTASERQVNANSPARRSTIASKVSSESIRMNGNTGLSSTVDESPSRLTKSSLAPKVAETVPKVTETAGKLGRSVTLRSIADARQRVDGQSLQFKSSVASQPSSARVLPPTQSRLPSSSRLSTASSPRSNGGSESGLSSSTVNNSTIRELRASVARQSFSAASSATTKVQVPSRKLSVPSSHGASELKKAEALKSTSRVNSSSLEQVNGGLSRPLKTGLNQSTSSTVRSQSKLPSSGIKVQQRTSVTSVQAAVKQQQQSSLDSKLQLQLSRCSSPSSELQYSAMSEKSTPGTTHSLLSKEAITSKTSNGSTLSSLRSPLSKDLLTNSTLTLKNISASQSERDHRSDKAQTQIITTSSAAQLSICFSHQPDLVTNSILSEQTATKLQQLQLQRSTLEQQISWLRCSLRHRTLGFEAMLMLFKRMSEEASPVTVSRLRAQLAAANNSLTSASTKCDILVQQRNALISEIQNVKEDHEVQINALTLTHEMALRSIEEQNEREVEKRIIECEEKHKATVESLKFDHTRTMNDLTQSHRKTMADKEQEVTSKLIDLEFSHKRKLAEMQRKHDNHVKELTTQLELTKVSLTAKVEQFKTECELLQRRHGAPPVVPSASSGEQGVCQSATPSASIDNMVQEIQSLTIVLDLRNSEINKLKAANVQLEKQLKELPVARETIQRLEQKLENAEAIVSMKVDFEKELAEKHKILIRLYDQESKDKKRLSMDNEQLMWRLTEEGLAPPPLTPNLVRRTISQPVPTKSAPGTPAVSRRKGLPSASSSSHRPLSQSDFDNFSAEDFVRDDEEYY